MALLFRHLSVDDHRWLNALGNGSPILSFAHHSISALLFRDVTAGSRNVASAFKPVGCSNAPMMLPLQSRRGTTYAKEKLACLAGEPKGLVSFSGQHAHASSPLQQPKKKGSWPILIDNWDIWLSDQGCVRNATPHNLFVSDALRLGSVKSVSTRSDLRSSFRLKKMPTPSPPGPHTTPLPLPPLRRLRVLLHPATVANTHPQYRLRGFHFLSTLAVPAAWHRLAPWISIRQIPKFLMPHRMISTRHCEPELLCFTGFFGLTTFRTYP